MKENINSSGQGVCYAPVYESPYCIRYSDGEVCEGFVIPCGRGRGDGFDLYFFIGSFATFFVASVVIGVMLNMIYRAV